MMVQVERLGVRLFHPHLELLRVSALEKLRHVGGERRAGLPDTTVLFGQGHLAVVGFAKIRSENCCDWSARSNANGGGSTARCTRWPRCKSKPHIVRYRTGRCATRQSGLSAMKTLNFLRVVISFGWGYATVSLQTKKIKGLHENDFILAAKIDRL